MTVRMRVKIVPLVSVIWHHSMFTSSRLLHYLRATECDIYDGHDHYAHDATDIPPACVPPRGGLQSLDSDSEVPEVNWWLLGN